MPMKPRGPSKLAPSKSPRPKSGAEARAGKDLERIMRPGGAADREGPEAKPRPKKNPYR